MAIMNNKNQYINAIGLILLIGFLLFIGLKRSYNLKRNPMYTIGVIKRIEGSKGGPGIIYEYHVNNKLYSAINDISYKDMKLIGKRYFVKFYKKNPKASELLLYSPVSDTFKNVPIGGWDNIP